MPTKKKKGRHTGKATPWNLRVRNVGSGTGRKKIGSMPLKRFR